MAAKTMREMMTDINSFKIVNYYPKSSAEWRRKQSRRERRAAQRKAKKNNSKQ